MTEYIEREAAIEAAKHAWEKGLEPSQYIEDIPAANVAPERYGRWEWFEECPYNEGCARIPRKRNCECCGWNVQKEKDDGEE